MTRRHLPLLIALAAASAQADTLYKCTDDSGHTTYTNQKGAAKKCAVLSQDQPVSTFSVPPRRAAATPGDFPRVAADTQKARDNDRRKIIENELATEQKGLEDAKKTLAEQEAVREGGERNYQRVLERLKPYQDNVELHQRNVEALQKELANTK